jgi:hypothetical protein
MTNVEKTRVLAHIFESIARGVEIDYAATDARDPKGCKEHYNDVFNTLVRDIECIKSKAQSITWKPEILQKLKCISVKPENIDSWSKGQVRGGCNGCMACNRHEECNYKALSMCGYSSSMFDPNASTPFTSLDNLMDDYVEYCNCYAEVESASKDKRKYLSFEDGFHEQDGGMLVMGEICHNRALLYNLASNWIFNWIYIIDNYIQDLEDSGQKIEKQTLYYNHIDDATCIHNSFMEMQRLSVSETSAIDDNALSIDEGWWKSVKTMRFGNLNVLASNKKGPERMAIYYRTLGYRGLSPMAMGQEIGSFEADADGSDDSDNAGVVERAWAVAPKRVAPKSAAATSRKRNVPEDCNHEASSSSEPHHDKRAELRNKLLKIKDTLVLSGDHKAAVTVMEAVLELH